MDKSILIVAIVGSIIVGIIISQPKLRNKITEPEPIACTMEAKICPDGSAVGRTGPNCEFAACPDSESINTGESSGIMGRVLLGPTCPVETIPPDPNCADKPYGDTRLAITTPDGSRVIKEFGSDLAGEFKIKISPGQYAIRSAAVANILPYCATNETIIVKKGKFTETVVHCDSGIR